MALSSGATPSSAQGAIFFCMQSSCPIYCAMTPALVGLERRKAAKDLVEVGERERRELMVIR